MQWGWIPQIRTPWSPSRSFHFKALTAGAPGNLPPRSPVTAFDINLAVFLGLLFLSIKWGQSCLCSVTIRGINWTCWQASSPPGHAEVGRFLMSYFGGRILLLKPWLPLLAVYSWMDAVACFLRFLCLASWCPGPAYRPPACCVLGFLASLLAYRAFHSLIHAFLSQLFMSSCSSPGNMLGTVDTKKKRASLTFKGKLY